ncbi:alpha/beta hydrolase family protein [Nocardia thailandica]
MRPLVALAVLLLSAGLLAAPGTPSGAEPGCAGGVSVTPVAVPVDGETATGRVYEPYRCAPGDLPARALVVAVHGHTGSSADLPEYMTSLARVGGAPLLLMDLRSADSVWRTGEWNLWAGQRDVVAATRWYREEHPGIGRTVLWGWSQGGITSGLAAAYAPPGTFDYWVDNYGPADTVTTWFSAGRLNGALPGEIERDAGGCTPAQCPAAYAARSPALLAGRMSVARAVLIHGVADDVVPYAASVEMRAGLTAAGKPLSFYTIVTGRDLGGAVVPGDHSIGPALFEGGCVVLRLLAGTEPLDGFQTDYLVDVANGLVTAPPAPAGAKCAA